MIANDTDNDTPTVFDVHHSEKTYISEILAGWLDPMPKKTTFLIVRVFLWFPLLSFVGVSSF